MASLYFEGVAIVRSCRHYRSKDTGRRRMATRRSRLSVEYFPFGIFRPEALVERGLFCSIPDENVELLGSIRCWVKG